MAGPKNPGQSLKQRPSVPIKWAGQVLGHAAMVGAGLVFVLAALIFLLQSVVSWLEVAGLPDEWGYLLVGLVVGGGGAALLTKGINALKETSVVPDRAVN